MSFIWYLLSICYLIQVTLSVVDLEVSADNKRLDEFAVYQFKITTDTQIDPNVNKIQIDLPAEYRAYTKQASTMSCKSNNTFSFTCSFELNSSPPRLTFIKYFGQAFQGVINIAVELLNPAIRGTYTYSMKILDASSTAIGEDSTIMSLMIDDDEYASSFAESYSCTLEACNTKATTQAENTALSNIYQTWGGANWIKATGWNSGDPCINQWLGVKCDADGHIVELNFPTSNKVAIPSTASIQGLNYLKAIRIFNLDYIDEYGNKDPSLNTIAVFPTALTQLTSLEIIEFPNVRMQGTIPTTINQLTNLKILNLANNNLTGAIPSLDALTKLRNLELSGNLLAGALPSLANLKNLEIALFYDNKLAGTLSFYPLLRLRVLDIGLNSISGKFPMEYYDLPSIEYIGLAGNTQMTSIPLPCVAYPLCFKGSVELLPV
eukprot:TRINITY_DN3025_c0_g1_i6.p1 TRINITY_DN3025_c0_g1~~TRINITY_DN3025_c0_g1_i6.p1  ORF type:complete len:435 (+),score=24.53 TRINITY_DN3025_c0_g1_i6:29-1333(+)